MQSGNTSFTLLILAVITGLFACTSIPDGAQAVKPFDSNKYLGKWYEIARLDFTYEKDLDHTTAEYSLNTNGTIKVDNKGFNTQTGKWEQAIGKAKFADKPDVGMLNVSFFGPFYAGYNVIAIDTAYRYALVAGSNLKYLWILSRQTTLPDDVKTTYLKIAESIGYHTRDLIWVKQD